MAELTSSTSSPSSQHQNQMPLITPSLQQIPTGSATLDDTPPSMELTSAEFDPSSVSVVQGQQIEITSTSTESVSVVTSDDGNNVFNLFGGPSNSYQVPSSGALFTIPFTVPPGTYYIWYPSIGADIQGTITVQTVQMVLSSTAFTPGSVYQVPGQSIQITLNGLTAPVSVETTDSGGNQVSLFGDTGNSYTISSSPATFTIPVTISPGAYTISYSSGSTSISGTIYVAMQISDGAITPNPCNTVKGACVPMVYTGSQASSCGIKIRRNGKERNLFQDSPLYPCTVSNNGTPYWIKSGAKKGDYKIIGNAAWSLATGVNGTSNCASVPLPPTNGTGGRPDIGDTDGNTTGTLHVGSGGNDDGGGDDDDGGDGDGNGSDNHP